MVVSDRDTVKDVKSKVQYKNEVPPDQQKLMFGGRLLKDDKRLSDYKIKDESKLDLVVQGGQ